MSEELLPCPFCGSNEVYTECMVYMPDGIERYYVECIDCGADVGIVKESNGTFGAYYATEDEAIDAWNRGGRA